MGIEEETFAHIAYLHKLNDYMTYVFHSEYGWVYTKEFGYNRPFIDVDNIAARASHAKGAYADHPFFTTMKPEDQEKVRLLNQIAIKQAISRMMDNGMTESDIKALMQDEQAFKAKCNEVNPKPEPPKDPSKN